MFNLVLLLTILSMFVVTTMAFLNVSDLSVLICYIIYEPYREQWQIKIYLKKHLEIKKLIMDRVKLKCLIIMLKNTLEIIQFICGSIKVKHVLKMLKITFRSMNSINPNDFSKNIISLLKFPLLHFAYFPKPKTVSRVRRSDFDPPPYGFSKKAFFREGDPLFFYGY